MKKTKFKNWMPVLGKWVVSFAFLVTVFNVNATCMYIAHQPKLPEGAKKLRKF